MSKNIEKASIGENKIHIAFPGIDDKYIDKALERMKKEGIPSGMDTLTWLGKLIVLEIAADELK